MGFIFVMFILLLTAVGDRESAQQRVGLLLEVTTHCLSGANNVFVNLKSALRTYFNQK